jgi:hypothetical protein
VQPALPPTYPTQLAAKGDAPFPITVSAAADIGVIVQEMPAEVTRMIPVEFAWSGGDPGAEMPQAPRVVLERQTAPDTFEEVKTPAQRPYDNRSSRMMTRLRPDGARWIWVVYWEELADFPAGEYRLRVEGHYQSDAGRTAYTATSRVFNIVPSEALEVASTEDAQGVVATLSYPAAPVSSYPGPNDDKGKVVGSYRMRDADVPSGAPTPLRIARDVDAAAISVTFKRNGNMIAQVDSADITLSEVPRRIRNRDGVPTTEASFAWPNNVNNGDFEMTITVTDLHGNTGSLTKTITR